jgi:hypothetical protein
VVVDVDVDDDVDVLVAATVGGLPAVTADWSSLVAAAPMPMPRSSTTNPRINACQRRMWKDRTNNPVLEPSCGVDCCGAPVRSGACQSGPCGASLIS